MIDRPQRLAATLSRSPDLEGPRRRAVVQLDAVLSFVGTVLSALGLAMLAPAGFDLADGSPEWRSFALSSVITLFVGRALVLANQGSFQRLGTREAALAAVIAWIAASLCGALPFMLMQRPMSFTDAVFEAVSGLTASGSTVFIGLDQAPRGILAWRFLLVWLGGLGLISFAVLFLPFLRVGGMQLFTLDLSARPGKFLPRFGQVVAAIAVVYLVLTVLCAIAFEAAGMERFDALGHAMAAIGTGGFSSHDASFGYWNSAAIEWVAVVFMAMAAMPFVLYVHLLRGDALPFLREDQVRLFLGVIALGVLALAGWRMVESGVPPFQALREASFTLVSIITCTGFTSTEQDYAQWGAFASVLVVTAMLVGGCTGSTAGGIKMFRLYVLFQTVRSQVAAQIYPSGSFPARYNGRVIPEAVRAGAVVYFFVYLASVAVLALALCFAGLDFLEGVSAAATALAGAGPALGPRIGPCCTYATLTDPAKWLFALGMLAGRLEILILALPFTRLFWRG
jgi:trk system potassium uptake protein TrkH